MSEYGSLWTVADSSFEVQTPNEIWRNCNFEIFAAIKCLNIGPRNDTPTKSFTFDEHYGKTT